MLEKLKKSIKSQALKIGWINREIQAHEAEMVRQRIEAEEKRIAEQIEAQRIYDQKVAHHHNWERIMRGQAMRDVGTEKDDRMLAVGMDTRGMGQRPFNPVFTMEDSIMWGTKNGGERY